MPRSPPRLDRSLQETGHHRDRAAADPRHGGRQAPAAARLRNYWGYNSIGYFAPDMRYSATGTLGEFKTMVKTLHAAGIEVILDVVYNHTGEGDHLGPTLCFRGIDNQVYYKLKKENPRLYEDYTGTGNTLNAAHPAVLQLIMDQPALLGERDARRRLFASTSPPRSRAVSMLLRKILHFFARYGRTRPSRR